MTDTQRAQIKELRLAGYGYKKIAQALSLSVNTVKSYCRKNNLAGVMAGKPSSADGKTYCKQCGKELLQKPNQKTLLFCCGECRQTWWNAHPEMVNKKAIYSYLCPLIPIRSAISIWFLIKDKSGLISKVIPLPSSLSNLVAIKYTILFPQPVR
jgi:hypothetical protein